MAHVTESANILIVDDNPDIIRLLSQLLIEKGYQVRATKESRKVLRIAASTPPDLFLLDVDMPVMNGYELCSALKMNESLQDIPVIFVSGYENPINKIQAFDVGGVDYISKPIHAGELVSRVNSHIELFWLQKKLQKQVEKQTKELEETLIALRVLMKQQKHEASDIEKNILSNINKLVVPFAQHLKKTDLDKNQASIVDILMSNLQQISESLIDDRDLLKMKLSPVEIQVANMIKEGKQTKEIASILNLSDLTISTHRKNIRKKLNINNHKLSLNRYLSSL